MRLTSMDALVKNGITCKIEPIHNDNFERDEILFAVIKMNKRMKRKKKQQYSFENEA